MASADEKKGRSQRRYRPTVERLEAVRLLSSATQAHPLAGVVAEHDLRAEASETVSHLGDGSQAVSSATWDAALVQTELADILGTGGGSTGTALSSTTTSEPKVAAPPVTTADTKR